MEPLFRRLDQCKLILTFQDQIDKQDTTYTFQIQRGLWIDGLPKTIENYQDWIQNGLFAWLLNQPAKQQSANVQFQVNKKNEIRVQALRKINAGEEYLVNYNRSSPDRKISIKSSSKPSSKPVNIET